MLPAGGHRVSLTLQVSGQGEGGREERWVPLSIRVQRPKSLGYPDPNRSQGQGPSPHFHGEAGQKSGQEERAQDSLPPAQEGGHRLQGAQKVCFLVVMSLDRPNQGSSHRHVLEDGPSDTESGKQGHPLELARERVWRTVSGACSGWGNAEVKSVKSHFWK